MSPTTTRSSERKQRPQAASKLEEELLDCVRQGEFDRTRELLEIDRVNVNCSDKRRVTPLINAVLFWRMQIARLLIDNGANLDAVNARGWSALAFTLFHHNDAVTELLLESGANVESRIPFPGRACSLLAYAIGGNNVPMIRLLLRFGANTAKTLFEGKMCSAVYIACCKNNLEIVQLLLNHDGGQLVGVNSTTPRSRRGDPAMSPLCWACTSNNMDIAQLLVQHGARVIFDDAGVYPDIPSPLTWAARRGSLELVQFLLDHSRFSEPVNENARLGLELGTSHPLSPPLEAATQSSKLTVAQLLVDRGANVNTKPFLWQCAGKCLEDLETVRFLLQNGANVNQADNDVTGQTPLWAAARLGHVRLVKELLKAGADVHIRDSIRGETPLGVAYRMRHLTCVYLLLRTSPHVWSKLAELVW